MSRLLSNQSYSDKRISDVLSNSECNQKRREEMSRRSLLIASLVGGSIACLPASGSLRADGPAGRSIGAPPVPAQLTGGKVTDGQRTAVHRMVDETSSKVIRLNPVRSEFGNVVVQAIATDPQGKIVAVAGDDHAIRILDSTTMELLATLQGHTDLIQTLHFDPAGNRLVSAGNDGQLILWNRIAGFQIIQQMQGTPALACVRFSPDGQEMAAVGFNNQVYLIGRSKRSNQPEVQCDCTDLRAVDYRGDGKLLVVAGRSGSLHLFDRPTYKLIGDYPIHSGRIHAIHFAKSSPVVVSVGEDGAVVLFDTDTQKTVRRIVVTGGKLFSVCVLDRQRLAVAGSDNLIRIVNLATAAEPETLEGHTGSVSTLASSGSALFSGGYDATLRRWQLSSVTGNRDRIAERELPIDR
ncbi:MAG: WD40 repeat domain-containing protein [Planctomycetales bacterium]|nr:WD40 repeat domain-containing protein [Planctomycetales bacterium]